MAHFKMCPECRREYDDPLDRRFHAQPNACWECGPQVWLEDAQGNRIAARDEALVKTVALLDAGSIVAIKGLGGFHLAVKATDEAAVSRLRSRKIREQKPFAVMFPELDDIRRYCLPERRGRKPAEKPGQAHRAPGEALGLKPAPQSPGASRRKTGTWAFFYLIRLCIFSFSKTLHTVRW